MTHFDAVKQMNLKQLAYTFYMMLRPFLEGFSNAEKKAVYDQIEQWLMQEVKDGT